MSDDKVRNIIYATDSAHCRNWDAVLVKINPKTGFLIFDNEPGVDIFPCMVCSFRLDACIERDGALDNR